MEQYMQLAIEEARRGMRLGLGGPFGAVIVRNDEVLAVACNRVLEKHDPTAHAEIEAIRLAGERLGSHDLSGCVLYATGEPCPMCLAAIIWANIKTCYFAADVQQALEIGFRDDLIYRALRGEQELLHLERLSAAADAGAELYAEYQALQHTLY